MPRLFSFVSTEHGGKQGVEAYFHGRYLVLEATGENGARASAPFAAPIQLKRWTCVAVEYRPGVAVGGGSSSSASTAAAGEARLYVDGVLAESHPVSLPRVRGSLGFCCMGTNPPAAMAGVQSRRRQCALYGALGPAYVFREAVGARRVAELTARGGSYVPGYGDVNPPLDPASIESEARRTDFHSRSIDRIGRSVDPGDGTGAGVGAGGPRISRVPSRREGGGRSGGGKTHPRPGSRVPERGDDNRQRCERAPTRIERERGRGRLFDVDVDRRDDRSRLARARRRARAGVAPTAPSGDGSRVGFSRAARPGYLPARRRRPGGPARIHAGKREVRAANPTGGRDARRRTRRRGVRVRARVRVCVRADASSESRPAADFDHLERRLRKKPASPRRFEPSADPS